MAHEWLAFVLDMGALLSVPWATLTIAIGQSLGLLPKNVSN